MFNSFEVNGMYVNGKFMGSVQSVDMSIDAESNVEGEIVAFSSHNHEASFTCNKCIDLLFAHTIQPLEAFKTYYSKPIMIQKRWHKKNRTNKKWLKRYGMVEDTVQMEADLDSFTNDPYSGECSWNMSNMKFKWKPHQMNKRRKVVMI